MVPNYRPSDIIDNVRRLLDGEEMLPMTPWYRGFQGSIERSGKHRFKVRGCVEKVNSTTLMITELPVGTWTNNYTDFLTRCVEEKRIDGFSNRSSDTQVCFEVKLSRKMMRAAEDQGLETCLKLESSLLTSEPLPRSEKNELSLPRACSVRRQHALTHSGRENCPLRAAHGDHSGVLLAATRVLPPAQSLTAQRRIQQAAEVGQQGASE